MIDSSTRARGPVAAARGLRLRASLLLLATSVATLSACSDDAFVLDPVSLCRCDPGQICVQDRCVSAADAGVVPSTDTQTTTCDPTTAIDVRIAELRTSGVAHPDFIELIGAPGGELDGLWLRGLDSGGAVRVSLALSGVVPDDGLWLGVFGDGLEDADGRLGVVGFASPAGVVEVVDCAGMRLDSVAYGVLNEGAPMFGEGAPAVAVEGNDAIGRCPVADFTEIDQIDTGDNRVDFHATEATPGAPNATLAQAPGCVACDPSVHQGNVWLAEVLYDPIGADEQSPAFVELRGITGTSLLGVSLERWDEASLEWRWVADLVRTFGEDGVIVVGEDDELVEADQTAALLDGDNDAGGYRLVTCNDTVLDVVGYGTLSDLDAIGVTEAAPDAGDDEALARCPDATLVELATWIVSTPSPGAANPCP